MNHRQKNLATQEQINFRIENLCMLKKHHNPSLKAKLSESILAMFLDKNNILNKITY